MSFKLKKGFIIALILVCGCQTNQNETGYSSSNKKEDLKITSYQPSGIAHEDAKIILSFNQPMVDIKPDSLVSKKIPFSIHPHIVGQGKWISSKTIQYQPSQPLQKATTYKVNVSPTFQSLQGRILGKSFEWEFKTQRFELTNTKPAVHDVIAQNSLIELIFNQNVNLSDVNATIELFVTNPLEGHLKKVIFESAYFQDKKNHIVLKLKENLDKGSLIEIHISQKMKGSEGPDPLAEDIILGYKIQENLFSFGPVCQNNCNPEDGIQLKFNQPVDLENLLKFVSIKPETKLLKPEWDSKNSTVLLKGDFKSDTTYEIYLDAKLKDTFGSMLASNQIYQFKTKESEPSFEFIENEEVISLFQNKSIPFKSNKIKKIEISLLRANADEVISVLKDSQWDMTQESLFKTLTPNHQWEIDVEKQLIDLSELLSQKTKNFLILEVSSKEIKNTFYRKIVKTGSQHIFAVSPETNDFWIVDSDLNAPVVKAQVTLRDQTGKTVWTGLSDENGLIYPKNINANGQTKFFIKSVYQSNESLLVYNFDKTINQNINLKLFVDRSLYFLKDEIKMMGWIFGENNQNSIYLVIKDKNEKKIWEKQIEADSEGLFNEKWQFPENLKPGFYQLTALKNSDSKNILAKADFEIISKRKLDYQFNYQIPTSPWLIESQSNLGVEITDKNKNPVKSLPIKLKLYRKPSVFKPHGADVSFHFSAIKNHVDSDFELVDKTSGLLNHEGKFQFDFKNLNPKTYQPQSYKLVAIFTDLAGETFEDQILFMGYPSHYSVGIKVDKFFVAIGEKTGVLLDAESFSSKDLKDFPVTITWYLKQQNNFKSVYQCQQNFKVKEKLCPFLPEESGEHWVEVVMKDDENRFSISSDSFWVYGKPIADSSSIVSQKYEVRAPLNLEVLILPPFENGLSLLSWGKSKYKISSFSFQNPVSQLDFQLEDGPKVKLKAIVVENQTGKKWEEAALFEFNNDHSLLNVDLKLDKPVYKPGDQSLIHLETKDYQGIPIPDAPIYFVVASLSKENPVTLFSDFQIKTDAFGKASFEVPVGDNQTIYEAFAFVTKANRLYGTKTLNFKVFPKLDVSIPLPEILRVGDELSLPLKVSNLTGEKQTFQFDTKNVSLKSGLESQISLEPYKSLETTQDFYVSNQNKISFSFNSDNTTFEKESEVEYPYPFEENFISGQTEDFKIHTITKPKNIDSEAGFLAVGLSSTPLLFFEDEWKKMIHSQNTDLKTQLYSWHTFIRMPHLVDAFDLSQTKKEQMADTLKSILETLALFETQSGGYSLWPHEDEADLKVSVKMAEFLKDLHQMTSENYPTDSLKNYLNLELENYSAEKPDYHLSRVEILKGLKTLGVSVEDLVLEFLENKPDSFVKICLMDILSQSLGHDLLIKPFINDQAQILIKTEKLNQIERQKVSLLIKIFLRVDTDSKYLPDLVNKLIYTPHDTFLMESAFQVLDSLSIYFQSKAFDQDFKSMIQNENEALMEAHFKGFSFKRLIKILKWSDLKENQTFVFRKEGQGQLYYHIHSKILPDHYPQHPIENGLSVKRVFENLDNDSQPLEIKLGEYLKQKVFVVVDKNQKNVIVEIPYASNLEILPKKLESKKGLLDGFITRIEKKPGLWILILKNLDKGAYEFSLFAKAYLKGQAMVPPVSAVVSDNPSVKAQGLVHRIVVR